MIKSKKKNILNKEETISTLASYDQQRQIKIAEQVMRLICKSGLGDVGFDNLNINKDTGKLIDLDTEPLFGSMLLDETEDPELEHQYKRNNKLKQICQNSSNVKIGLDKMVEACENLPIFKKVAEIYRENFKIGMPGLYPKEKEG